MLYMGCPLIFAGRYKAQRIENLAAPSLFLHVAREDFFLLLPHQPSAISYIGNKMSIFINKDGILYMYTETKWILRTDADHR